MELISFKQENAYEFPVSGNGTNLVNGALLSAGQAQGQLRVTQGGTTTSADYVAILRQAHTASGFDTTVSGTVFTTRKCELVFRGQYLEAYWSMASADLITCTQAVSTTTLTLTSLETDISAGFIYVVSGTGAGQTNYITASASGSCTLKAAFTTSLDTTSKIIKILPRFNQLVAFSTDGISLSSTAAAGGGTVVILDTFIVRNGAREVLDPTKHSALTGLSDAAQANYDPTVKFGAKFMVRNAAPYTLD